MIERLAIWPMGCLQPMNSRSDAWMLALLRQRVEEQKARWQETQGQPGQVMTWQAADLFIDQGQRAVIDLETYLHPPINTRATVIEKPSPEHLASLKERENEIIHDLGF